MAKEISISQALTWMKTLKARHSELISLRDDNKNKNIYWRENKEDYIKEPTYDIRHLDKLVSRLALEIRRLDDAIKYVNASTDVPDYTCDESVLGEIK